MVVAAPFGIYYGVIIGTLGGGLAETYMGEDGIYLGIIFSLVLVTGGIVSFGSFLGERAAKKLFP